MVRFKIETISQPKFLQARTNNYWIEPGKWFEVTDDFDIDFFRKNGSFEEEILPKKAFEATPPKKVEMKEEVKVEEKIETEVKEEKTKKKKKGMFDIV